MTDVTPQAAAEAPPPRADRRPRVVYVAHRVPFPPDKGDRIRNYHLLRQLAATADVSLACLADEPVGLAAFAELRSLAARLAVVPVSKAGRLVRAGVSVLAGGSLSEGAFFHPELVRVLADWQRTFPADAVVVSASSLAPYLRTPALEDVPAFVDLVDVDSQKWSDFAAVTRGPKRWLYSLEARRLQRLEAALPKVTRAVSLVSRAEADVYDAFAGAGTATVAMNGVDLDYFTPTDVPEEPACVFVGALDYLPNVDAAGWFTHEVWPLVRQKYPTAEFRLVGRSPTKAVQRLAQMPGVKLVGPVPDVRPELARAAVAVVPMRLARGLQNKVLEALAAGKATVAAPPALAALAAVPGRDLLAAKSPAEWSDAVCGLLSDPARRSALGAAGRRFVEANHHWDRCLAPLTDKIFAACPV